MTIFRACFVGSPRPSRNEVNHVCIPYSVKNCCIVHRRVVQRRAQLILALDVMLIDEAKMPFSNLLYHFLVCPRSALQCQLLTVIKCSRHVCQVPWTAVQIHRQLLKEAFAKGYRQYHDLERRQELTWRDNHDLLVEANREAQGSGVHGAHVAHHVDSGPPRDIPFLCCLDSQNQMSRDADQPVQAYPVGADGGNYGQQGTQQSQPPYAQQGNNQSYDPNAYRQVTSVYQSHAFRFFCRSCSWPVHLVVSCFCPLLSAFRCTR